MKSEMVFGGIGKRYPKAGQDILEKPEMRCQIPFGRARLF